MHELHTTRPTLAHYFADLNRLILEVDQALVESMVDRLYEAWKRDQRVLLAGNGGSSSSVSHIVADLQKNVFLASGKALKTMCLSDSTPLLTAWANDTEYANVFAPQVKCWGEAGDVLIAVSGSGNSPNILNCVIAAREAGMQTFGLAGYDGGKLRGLVDHCLVVNSDSMQRIEDVHMAVLHGIYVALIERLSSRLR